MARCAFAVLVCAFAAQSAVLVEHDYDPVSDSVISWRIDPGRSVGQSITLPAGITKLSGFRVRLHRVGTPAALSFRLGTARGHDDIASGRLDARNASPWFEHWSTVRFRKPAEVTPASHVFLELHLASDSHGAYELFGTSSEPVARPEFRARFQFIPDVNPGQVSARFENPANIDYGLETPRYNGGAAFDANGTLLVPIDFAFQIFDGDTPPIEGEERFAFIDEITGPLFPKLLRDAAARPASNEVALDGGWRVRAVTPMGEPAVTASVEFRDFLRQAMGVAPAADSSRAIVMTVGCKGVPARSESFRLRVTTERVEICGADARGVMQGLHYLEARMRLRRAPFLTVGEETRQTVQSPRITSAPFYSRSEMEVPVDPYTPGLLGRIARAGFNAIWVWGDIEDLGHSPVYPELEREVDRHQARLRGLIERAAHYGIDVYLHLGNRPPAAAFFARHPETQGHGDALVRRHERALHQRGRCARALPRGRARHDEVGAGAEGLRLHCGRRGLPALLDAQHQLPALFKTYAAGSDCGVQPLAVRGCARGQCEGRGGLLAVQRVELVVEGRHHAIEADCAHAGRHHADD